MFSEQLHVSAGSVFSSHWFANAFAWLYCVLTDTTNLCVSQTTHHVTRFTSTGLCCLVSAVYVDGAEGTPGRLLHFRQAAVLADTPGATLQGEATPIRLHGG